MLSIKAITNSGSASDYYNAADYYAKDDDSTSVSSWLGKGAQELGLKGPVDAVKFKELLEGKVEDKQLGVIINGELKHKCGWDLTFSAPKSVSMVALIGNDKRLLQAVKEASDETIKYVEKEYAITRQMDNGKLIKANEKNIVCASFLHTTSRELDPQAHVHNVLLNMVKRADGQWRSIESRGIYEDSMLLGLMYRSNLASKVCELGYEIEVDPKTGFFEIKGVERDEIEHFSKRRGQIEKLAENSKVSNAKAMDRLNLISRKSKNHVSKDELTTLWNKEAKEVNFDPSMLIDKALRNANKVISSEQNIHTLVDLCAKSLFEMEAVITKETLLRKSLTIAMGKFKLNDIDQAIDKAIVDKKIFISNLATDNTTQAFTTKESLRVESYILNLAKQGRGIKESIIASRELSYVLKDSGLNEGQEAAVRHIATTPDQVIAIQGYAGTDLDPLFTTLS